MRTRSIVVLTAALGALAGAAAPAAGQAGARTSAVSEDPRTETIAKLLAPLTVRIDDATLEDVIGFLSQATDAPIDAVWDHDDPSGLDADARVSINAENQPALSVLERVLERHSSDLDPATWQIDRDGIVEVGPRSALNRRAYLKIYDVRDMTMVIPDFTDVPDLELGQIVQGGGGGSQQNVDLEPDEGPTEQETLDRIVEIIRTNVEFEQWRANGGDAADLRVSDGLLIIRAPDYMHRQIGGYDFWPTEAQVRRAAGR